MTGIGNFIACIALSFVMGLFVNRKILRENMALREQNRLLMGRNLELKLDRPAELLVGDGNFLGGSKINARIDVNVTFKISNEYE